MTNDTFIKFDHEKPRPELIPPKAMLEIVKVLTYGAKKYSAGNYIKDGATFNRYYAAALRHMLQWQALEDTDGETGLSHIAHAATNLIFLLSMIENGVAEDDRLMHRIQERVKQFKSH